MIVVANALVVSLDPGGSFGTSKPDTQRKAMGRNSLGQVLPNDLKIDGPLRRSTANQGTKAFPLTYLPRLPSSITTTIHT